MVKPTIPPKKQSGVAHAVVTKPNNKNQKGNTNNAGSKNPLVPSLLRKTKGSSNRLLMKMPFNIGGGQQQQRNNISTTTPIVVDELHENENVTPPTQPPFRNVTISRENDNSVQISDLTDPPVLTTKTNTTMIDQQHDRDPPPPIEEIHTTTKSPTATTSATGSVIHRTASDNSVTSSLSHSIVSKSHQQMAWRQQQQRLASQQPTDNTIDLVVQQVVHTAEMVMNDGIELIHQTMMMEPPIGCPQSPMQTHQEDEEGDKEKLIGTGSGRNSAVPIKMNLGSGILLQAPSPITLNRVAVQQAPLRSEHVNQNAADKGMATNTTTISSEQDERPQIPDLKSPVSDAAVNMSQQLGDDLKIDVGDNSSSNSSSRNMNLSPRTDAAIMMNNNGGDDGVTSEPPITTVESTPFTSTADQNDSVNNKNVSTMKEVNNDKTNRNTSEYIADSTTKVFSSKQNQKSKKNSPFRPVQALLNMVGITSTSSNININNNSSSRDGGDTKKQPPEQNISTNITIIPESATMSAVVGGIPVVMGTDVENADIIGDTTSTEGSVKEFVPDEESISNANVHRAETTEELLSTNSLKHRSGTDEIPTVSTAVSSAMLSVSTNDVKVDTIKSKGSPPSGERLPSPVGIHATLSTMSRKSLDPPVAIATASPTSMVPLAHVSERRIPEDADEQDQFDDNYESDIEFGDHHKEAPIDDDNDVVVDERMDQPQNSFPKSPDATVFDSPSSPMEVTRPRNSPEPAIKHFWGSGTGTTSEMIALLLPAYAAAISSSRQKQTGLEPSDSNELNNMRVPIDAPEEIDNYEDDETEHSQCQDNSENDNNEDDDNNVYDDENNVVHEDDFYDTQGLVTSKMVPVIPAVGDVSDIDSPEEEYTHLGDITGTVQHPTINSFHSNGTDAQTKSSEHPRSDNNSERITLLDILLSTTMSVEDELFDNNIYLSGLMSESASLHPSDALNSNSTKRRSQKSPPVPEDYNPIEGAGEDGHIKSNSHSDSPMLLPTVVRSTSTSFHKEGTSNVQYFNPFRKEHNSTTSKLSKSPNQNSMFSMNSSENSGDDVFNKIAFMNLHLVPESHRTPFDGSSDEEEGIPAPDVTSIKDKAEILASKLLSGRNKNKNDAAINDLGLPKVPLGPLVERSNRNHNRPLSFDNHLDKSELKVESMVHSAPEMLKRATSETHNSRSSSDLRKDVNKYDNETIYFPKEIEMEDNGNISDLDQSLRHFPLRMVEATDGTEVMSALDYNTQDAQETITTRESFDEMIDRYAVTPSMEFFRQKKRSVGFVGPDGRTSPALADSITEADTVVVVPVHESANTMNIVVSSEAGVLGLCNPFQLKSMFPMGECTHDTEIKNTSVGVNEKLFPGNDEVPLAQLDLEDDLEDRGEFTDTGNKNPSNEDHYHFTSIPEPTPRISNEAHQAEIVKVPEEKLVSNTKNVKTVSRKSLRNKKNVHEPLVHRIASARARHFFDDVGQEDDVPTSSSTEESDFVDFAKDDTIVADPSGIQFSERSQCKNNSSFFADLHQAESNDYNAPFDRYRSVDETPINPHEENVLETSRVCSTDDSFLESITALGKKSITMSPKSKEMFEARLGNMTPLSKSVIEKAINFAKIDYAIALAASNSNISTNAEASQSDEPYDEFSSSKVEMINEIVEQQDVERNNTNESGEIASFSMPLGDVPLLPDNIDDQSLMVLNLGGSQIQRLIVTKSVDGAISSFEAVWNERQIGTETTLTNEFEEKGPSEIADENSSRYHETKSYAGVDTSLSNEVMEVLNSLSIDALSSTEVGVLDDAEKFASICESFSNPVLSQQLKITRSKLDQELKQSVSNIKHGSRRSIVSLVDDTGRMLASSKKTPIPVYDLIDLTGVGSRDELQDEEAIWLFDVDNGHSKVQVHENDVSICDKSQPTNLVSNEALPIEDILYSLCEGGENIICSPIYAPIHQSTKTDHESDDNFQKEILDKNVSSSVDDAVLHNMICESNSLSKREFEIATRHLNDSPIGNIEEAEDTPEVVDEENEFERSTLSKPTLLKKEVDSVPASLYSREEVSIKNDKIESCTTKDMSSSAVLHKPDGNVEDILYSICGQFDNALCGSEGYEVVPKYITKVNDDDQMKTSASLEDGPDCNSVIHTHVSITESSVSSTDNFATMLLKIKRDLRKTDINETRRPIPEDFLQIIPSEQNFHAKRMLSPTSDLATNRRDFLEIIFDTTEAVLCGTKVPAIASDANKKVRSKEKRKGRKKSSKTSISKKITNGTVAEQSPRESSDLVHEQNGKHDENNNSDTQHVATFQGEACHQIQESDIDVCDNRSTIVEIANATDIPLSTTIVDEVASEGKGKQNIEGNETDQFDRFCTLLLGLDDDGQTSYAHMKTEETVGPKRETDEIIQQSIDITKPDQASQGEQESLECLREKHTSEDTTSDKSPFHVDNKDVLSKVHLKPKPENYDSGVLRRGNNVSLKSANISKRNARYARSGPKPEEYVLDKANCISGYIHVPVDTHIVISPQINDVKKDVEKPDVADLSTNSYNHYAKEYDESIPSYETDNSEVLSCSEGRINNPIPPGPIGEIANLVEQVLSSDESNVRSQCTSNISVPVNTEIEIVNSMAEKDDKKNTVEDLSVFNQVHSMDSNEAIPSNDMNKFESLSRSPFDSAMVNIPGYLSEIAGIIEQEQFGDDTSKRSQSSSLIRFSFDTHITTSPHPYNAPENDGKQVVAQSIPDPCNNHINKSEEPILSSNVDIFDSPSSHLESGNNIMPWLISEIGGLVEQVLSFDGRSGRSPCISPVQATIVNTISTSSRMDILEDDDEKQSNVELLPNSYNNYFSKSDEQTTSNENEHVDGLVEQVLTFDGKSVQSPRTSPIQAPTNSTINTSSGMDIATEGDEKQGDVELPPKSCDQDVSKSDEQITSNENEHFEALSRSPNETNKNDILDQLIDLIDFVERNVEETSDFVESTPSGEAGFVVQAPSAEDKAGFVMQAPNAEDKSDFVEEAPSCEDKSDFVEEAPSCEDKSDQSQCASLIHQHPVNNNIHGSYVPILTVVSGHDIGVVQKEIMNFQDELIMDRAVSADFLKENYRIENASVFQVVFASDVERNDMDPFNKESENATSKAFAVVKATDIKNEATPKASDISEIINGDLDNSTPSPNTELSVLEATRKLDGKEISDHPLHPEIISVVSLDVSENGEIHKIVTFDRKSLSTHSQPHDKLFACTSSTTDATKADGNIDHTIGLLVKSGTGGQTIDITEVMTQNENEFDGIVQSGTYDRDVLKPSSIAHISDNLASTFDDKSIPFEILIKKKDPRVQEPKPLENFHQEECEIQLGKKMSSDDFCNDTFGSEHQLASTLKRIVDKPNEAEAISRMIDLLEEEIGDDDGESLSLILALTRSETDTSSMNGSVSPQSAAVSKINLSRNISELLESKNILHSACETNQSKSRSRLDRVRVMAGKAKRTLRVDHNESQTPKSNSYSTVVENNLFPRSPLLVALLQRLNKEPNESFDEDSKRNDIMKKSTDEVQEVSQLSTGAANKSKQVDEGSIPMSVNIPSIKKNGVNRFSSEHERLTQNTFTYDQISSGVADGHMIKSYKGESRRVSENDNLVSADNSGESSINEVVCERDELLSDKGERSQIQLSNILEQLEINNVKSETFSITSTDIEPVDVDDLFKRYDKIVKQMVVLDEVRLAKAQALPSPSTNRDKQKQKQVTKEIAPRLLRTRSHSTGSIGIQGATSDLTTPSQKARNLRRQLEKALESSASIRTSQTKLQEELSTLQLKVKNHKANGNKSSPGRSRFSSRSAPSSPQVSTTDTCNRNYCHRNCATPTTLPVEKRINNKVLKGNCDSKTIVSDTSPLTRLRERSGRRRLRDFLSPRTLPINQAAETDISKEVRVEETEFEIDAEIPHDVSIVNLLSKSIDTDGEIRISKDAQKKKSQLDASIPHDISIVNRVSESNKVATCAIDKNIASYEIANFSNKDHRNPIIVDLVSMSRTYDDDTTNGNTNNNEASSDIIMNYSDDNDTAELQQHNTAHGMEEDYEVQSILCGLIQVESPRSQQTISTTTAGEGK